MDIIKTSREILFKRNHEEVGQDRLSGLRYNKMTKDKEYNYELGNKIVKGMKLAFEKLLIEKTKNDEERVFSKGGKIIFVKAKDLLKKK
jgi:hypothetical protein